MKTVNSFQGIYGINFGSVQKAKCPVSLCLSSDGKSAELPSADLKTLSEKYIIGKQYTEALKPILTPERAEIIKTIVPERTGESGIFELADVLRRRNHTKETALQGASTFDGSLDKIINTLEFKNYNEVKDITLDTYKNLPLETKKDFLNSVISVKFYGTEGSVRNLPDMAIFEPFKSTKYPQMPENMFSKEFKEYKINLAEINSEVSRSYYDMISAMVKELPGGKGNIPVKPLTLEDGVKLKLKPPFSDSVESIPTEETEVNGVTIRTGKLPKDGHYFVHNLRENYFPMAEALLLTDEDAILCTGYAGGKGYLKSCGDKPGIILAPKSMSDLLIQAKNDMSSGYGAVKNLFNIQHKFLTEDNEANNYLPDLIKQRLSLTDEQYDEKMQNLADKGVRFMSEIKDVDEELYNATLDVANNEQMFEGIMRPMPEAVLLPESFEITPYISDFAHRYDIPVLFS